MAENIPNNAGSNLSNEEPAASSTVQAPPATVREFIHVDTSSNSRLNKGLENDIEIKSSSDIQK